MYGQLFQPSKGLGALVLFAEDGSMGYELTSFTCGALISGGRTNIPKRVKRFKDVLPMILEKIPEWIAMKLNPELPIGPNNELTAGGRAGHDVHLTLWTMDDRSPNINACTSHITSLLKGMSFDKITFSELTKDKEHKGYFRVDIIANHPMKMFSY